MIQKLSEGNEYKFVDTNKFHLVEDSFIDWVTESFPEVLQYTNSTEGNDYIRFEYEKELDSWRVYANNDFTKQSIDCFITVKLVGKDWVVAYNLNKQHAFYFEDLLAEAESTSMQNIVTEIKPSPYTKRIFGIPLKNYSDEDVATFEQYLLDSNLVVLECTKLKNGASYELYRAVDSLTIPLTSMLDSTASSLIKGLQRERFKDATSVVLRVIGSTEDCDTFAKELINKARVIARYLDKEVDGYQSRRYFNNVFVLRGGDDFEFWEDL